ncbi:MAG TPA: NADH-quinone oxidoreductase subunit H [Clostridia bacterium]|nr:NADH-quinone oxidoreductase subunit H [Clostridia bacterium]
MLLDILKILLFPGFAFLAAYAFLLEYVDRKAYARMQNRVGPPWYQPLADFFKLLGKKVIIPRNAGKRTFAALPVVSLAAVATAYVSVPVWGRAAIVGYEGDLVVVLYLLSIPTICLFLAGFSSHDVYTIMGAFRTLTQMFAYEVPLFIAFLSPAVLAGTWSITGILAFYAGRPLLALVNLPAFFIALLSAQSKLERAPFDAPEAETEIVGGALVEYGVRYLAFMHASAMCELAVVTSAIAALFLPVLTGFAAADFALYLIKTLALLLLLTLLRASVARIRMDQMLNFCWMVMTPMAIIQIVVNLFLRGGLGL